MLIQRSQNDQSDIFVPQGCQCFCKNLNAFVGPHNAAKHDKPFPLQPQGFFEPFDIILGLRPPKICVDAYRIYLAVEFIGQKMRCAQYGVAFA